MGGSLTPLASSVKNDLDVLDSSEPDCTEAGEESCLPDVADADTNEEPLEIECAGDPMGGNDNGDSV